MRVYRSSEGEGEKVRVYRSSEGKEREKTISHVLQWRGGGGEGGGEVRRVTEKEVKSKERESA